jgi:hypothetical protein
MPRIDFDRIDDVHDFAPVPPGKYRCRLTGIEEASADDGSEKWRLTFTILDGPFAGRKLFDNLPFSEKGIGRAKLILGRLGYPTSGVKDVQPNDIVNKTCFLTAEIEEYPDATGTPKKRNKIPFAGYDRDQHEAAASPAPGPTGSPKKSPF